MNKVHPILYFIRCATDYFFFFFFFITKATCNETGVGSNTNGEVEKNKEQKISLYV